LPAWLPNDVPAHRAQVMTGVMIGVDPHKASHTAVAVSADEEPRVRLLAAEAVNKNDPNDARSVAVTALRSRTVREVMPDDHCSVLKMWSRRHHDLGRNRTRIACRLHAALCELVPGGIGKEIIIVLAERVLAQAAPSGAVQQARAELAADLLEELRRADEQLREKRKRLAGRCRPRVPA
jgi:transposase